MTKDMRLSSSILVQHPRQPFTNIIKQHSPDPIPNSDPDPDPDPDPGHGHVLAPDPARN